ncbi:hypothetical protein ACFPOH_07330 [Ureibacillus suwonensis]|uniref:Uncharacterized protein n=1 Tax=Ureibacillus suwonensis TaxID=313007 RepID=A0ABW0RE20_9BACL
MFRRVYFNKLTGNKIATYSFDREISVIPTFEEDKKTYDYFNGINDEVIGYFDLMNGEYEQDFRESQGNFRVNVELLASLPEGEEYKALEFYYPDPNATEPQEPVYQKPLSEELEETKEAIAELTLLLTTMTGGV